LLEAVGAAFHGIVVIPPEKLDEVLKTAEGIFKKGEAVCGGLTLTEARVKYRYHSLQSKQ
jgi:hypothetical protein